MNTTIATRLSYAREQAGLSVGQVARRTGWKVSKILGMEAGDRPVSEQETALFAELYGVSAKWLAGNGMDEIAQWENPLRLAARAEGKVNARELDDLVQFLQSVRS